ncbi:MAG: Rrf2 family transcriptional regulator [Planctomycetes bacterium]|nr:Rrf2 family transcriptional regulator [Planctomycetota bacterium]
MRFTAQEEYGLRCILHLARAGCYPGSPEADRDGGSGPPGGEAPWRTVSEIAESEGLTEQYTGKLFRVLARSRLVESVRGRHGGYRMTRPPCEIALAEALAALGGRLYEPSHCDRYRGHLARCAHSKDCSVRLVWRGIQSMVDRVLAGIQLSDLLCDRNDVKRWMASHVDAVIRTTAQPVRGIEQPAGGLVQIETAAPGDPGGPLASPHTGS